MIKKVKKMLTPQTPEQPKLKAADILWVVEATDASGKIVTTPLSVSDVPNWVKEQTIKVFERLAKE